MFALNLPDQAIVKIALEMVADLREVLSILDRYEQQKAIVGFRANTPAAIERPASIRKCPDRQSCQLLQPRTQCPRAPSDSNRSIRAFARLGVDNVGVIDNRSERRRKRNR